jgi:hypothetical protein
MPVPPERITQSQIHLYLYFPRTLQKVNLITTGTRIPRFRRFSLHHGDPRDWDISDIINQLSVIGRGIHLLPWEHVS